MKNLTDKILINKIEAGTNCLQKKKRSKESTSLDNNTSKITQLVKNLEGEMTQGKFELIQEKANNTGLPDNLKSGIENLAGFALDDVKVHFSSDKPAQLNAFAFAQGTNIHIAPGQEKHLPHEAWHVVQQKKSTVKPKSSKKLKKEASNDFD